MTFPLTSPRRSHLLHSVVTFHPYERANSRPPTILHLSPLGIIGDFLNLLNRPLDRNFAPSLSSFSLSLSSLFFLLNVLPSFARSVEFHPRGDRFFLTSRTAVRPDEGLVRARPPLSTLLFIFQTFPHPPSCLGRTLLFRVQKWQLGA